MQVVFEFQQPGEGVARLDAFGRVKLREVIAPACAVELRQGIEAVHVAEVEQPDLPAVVDHVAGAEVPFEKALGGQRTGAGEQLRCAPRVETSDLFTFDPRRYDHALVQRTVHRRDDARQANSRLPQAAQFGVAQQFVEKRGLAVDVAHQAFGTRVP